MRLPLVVVLGNGAALVTSGVIAAALPAIARDFGVGEATGLWLADAFVVGVVVVTPLAASLIDRLGAGRVVAASCALLAAASAAVAVVGTYAGLVAVAALLGVFAAPIVPATQSLVAGFYPEERLARGMALWNAGSVGGLLLGLLVGGWAATEIGWRVAFLATPALALIAAATAIGLPRATAPVHRLPALRGAVLLATAVGATVVALNLTGPLGWTSPTVLGGLAVAVTSAALLDHHLRRTDRPILHLEVLRHAPTALAVGLNVLVAAASTGQIENDLLEGPLAFSAETVALRGAMGSGVVLLAGLAADVLVARLGTRATLHASLLLLTLGTASFLLYRPGVALLTTYWTEALRDVGAGAAIVTLAVLVYRGVPTPHQTHVATVYVLSTWLGRAVGLALLSSVEATADRAAATPLAGPRAAVATEIALVTVALLLAVTVRLRMPSDAA